MRRLPRMAALLAVLATIAAGCGESDPEPAAEAKTFKIAVVGPMSGDYKVYGDPMLHGAQLVAGELNAAGGLAAGPYKGSKIEIVNFDDQFDTKQAADAAQKVVDDPDIWAFTGLAISDNALAAKPILARAGVALVATDASAPAITADAENAFIVATPNAAYAYGAVDAAKERGATKAAVIQISGALGDSLTRLGKEEMDRVGIAVASEQTITSGQTDLRAELLKAKDSGADTLYAVVYNTELIAILNALDDVDWHPIIADPNGTGYNPTIQATLGSQAEGMVGSVDYDEKSTDPRNQAFVSKYQAMFGKDELLQPAIHSVEAIKLVIAGLELGPKDRTELGPLLYDVTVPDQGVGELRFDDDGNPLGRRLYVYLYEGGAATIRFTYAYDGKTLTKIS